jgi:small conductance mechanosensitive channel
MDLALTSEVVGNWAAVAWASAAAFLPRLFAALLILVFGLALAGWAAGAARRLSERSGRIDPTLRPVIGAVVRYGLLILVLVAVLAQIGVQTASVLAVLGAAGLAIGLALQGTLSNVAAGIMLLWLRPFRVGDAIERDGGIAGTVEELDLFHTQIRTFDGVYRFVPNAQLWNAALTNYSRNPTRLVRISFFIGYEDDMGTARSILLDMAKSHPNVLAEPKPEVVPLELRDVWVVLELRAWAQNAVFWDTRWELTQDGKARLDAAGITASPRPPAAPAPRAGAPA